jgi:hypothetical protein
LPSILKGRWEPVYVGNNPSAGVLNSQQTAVHACLAYNPNDGTWKVLYFRAADLEENNTWVKTRLWRSAATNQITAQRIPDWPGAAQNEKPRLFCGGHAFMHDGKLFVAGGNLGPVHEPFTGLRWAYTFDSTVVDENQKWNYLQSQGQPQPMQNGRWYPTVTLLPDRRLLVMSGYIVGPPPGQPAQPSNFNRVPEIWNPQTGQWIRRTALQAEMPFLALYPGAHLVPRGQYQGQVFYSMPMRQAYVFDPNFDGIPNGSYYWSPVAGLRQGPVRGGGCSILLPIKPAPNTEAKVLILGGDDYDSQFGTNVATNTTEIIDLGATTPGWQFASPMVLERTHANAIILPDGKILVTGGNQVYFREGAVTFAEIYDPDTNTWTLLPPGSYTRMYHSASILLPDATVWVAGGDALGGSPSSDFIEIYKPGYLFDGPHNVAQQPTILSVSTSQIAYNSIFTITTDLAIDSAILISLGATTHAFDQNQRAIWLNVTKVPSINGLTYSVSTPANANIAPPGYYMFFVLRPKSASQSGTNRIPSVAKFLRLA